MDKLEATFTLEKDTKNTRRYTEDPGDGPPIIATIYVQQWALRKLGGGKMPDKIRVTVEVAE
jgi:hypothetical protein